MGLGSEEHNHKAGGSSSANNVQQAQLPPLSGLAAEVVEHITSSFAQNCAAFGLPSDLMRQVGAGELHSVGPCYCCILDIV